MLNNFVSVYVPGTREVNKKLTSRERADYTARVGRKLSESFGGSTATKGIGFYVSNDGTLIQESITIVKSFYDGIPVESAYDTARTIAQWLKAELTQESVTIESNEGIEFV